MRIFGLSKLGRRAQHVVKDDARCAELLGVECGEEFDIYWWVLPHDEPAWAGYYSLKAKIAPLDESHTIFRLSHVTVAGHWHELDVEGTFEFCVRQIMENRYHLFFG